MNKNNMQTAKIFGCNIHGSIRISAMALKIINTKEFQRMHYIKQLSLCFHVYPAAIHTRFEHSLGVYHLTGLMLERIQKQYPEKMYDICGKNMLLTNKLIECIKIAGLCHDIGHGPFSHTFDNVLLKNSEHPNRNHEMRSCKIMEIICQRELPDELDSNHIEFMKSIICPGNNNTGALYQIVSNNLNGIDVDKFDYLTRDSQNLGLHNRFNYMRLINEFLIDENNNIAYPRHCSIDIYEMFHSRYILHKKVYSHKTVKLLETMLYDIFIMVDPIFAISESIKDMNKFCNFVDDTIFHYIETIMFPESFYNITLSEEQHSIIKKAHTLCNRITTRQLYQQVITITKSVGTIEKITADTVGFSKFIYYLENKYQKSFQYDLQIKIMRFGFLNDDKQDPFKTIYFYDPKKQNGSFTLERKSVSAFLNDNLQELHIFLICKTRSLYSTIMTELSNYQWEQPS